MTVALILDVLFVAAMTFAKAGMVFGLTYALAREEAYLSFRKCLAIALVVDLVYLLSHTATGYEAMIKAAAVASLVGAVAVKGWLELEWGKSLVIGGLLTVFGVTAGEYSVRLLDEAVPERPSVARNLTDTFDRYVRSSSGNHAMERSESVAQSLYAAIHQAVGGTVADGVTGQVRAGMITVNKVKTIQDGAARRVEFIDNLSDTGISTHLGDDAYDMAKQMEDYAAEKEQAEESPAQTASPETPPATLPQAPAEPDHAAGDPRQLIDGSGTMVLRGEVSADPDIRLSSDEVVEIIRELTREDRRIWAAAQKQIRVCSTLKFSGGKSAAVVNGDIVEPGGIVSVTIDEVRRSYRLVSVGSDEVYWSPVRANGSSDEQKLLRMTF